FEPASRAREFCDTSISAGCKTSCCCLLRRLTARNCIAREYLEAANADSGILCFWSPGASPLGEAKRAKNRRHRQNNLGAGFRLTFFCCGRIAHQTQTKPDISSPIIIWLHDWGRQASTGAVTSVAMHAGPSLCGDRYQIAGKINCQL